MKAFAQIFVVLGCEKHFSGDMTTRNLRAYAHEKDAIEYGAQWANVRNKDLKDMGLNVHASYKLDILNLY